MIVDAPWYVSNATLHADLGISYVHEVIHQKCNKHHTTPETQESPLLKRLLLREENRRLKRNWPIDLIRGTGIRRWTTTHQDIVIITTLAYIM
jgi:hypothetical protein